MKILAIRGKNLASLEAEFSIDFTEEPLKSAGIFAITGNTGAGKSTILDALCLALFDDAPRLKQAESININDVEDKTITQKDSRNILRRGAVEGFAEIDFISLNGDKYRSRWMVRRARGKAGGALQNTVLKLENLSTSTEEQGTKTDILNRIKEIIGLDFSQFTRAVLLAQGDFANFLKASQKEKAELLEKLTGTDIYARISALIYQKTGDAKTQLDSVQQRISDIQLPADEEIEAYNKEKNELQSQTAPLKEQEQNIEKKRAWFRTEETLLQDVQQANHELHKIQAQVNEAIPRFRYMEMIDMSNGIRDTYLACLDQHRQYNSMQENLTAKKEEQKNIADESGKINNQLLEAKTKYQENENNYEALKPELAKARELDIKIQAAKEKVAGSTKEVELQAKQKQESENEIKQIESRTKKLNAEIGSIVKWFDEHEAYRPIISHTELLISQLDTAQTAQKQKNTLTGYLEAERTLLENSRKQLDKKEREAQKLDNLLPTEILNLRSKLENGMPCPVCGSTHHPLREIAQDISIDEEGLIQAKEQTAIAVKELKDTITAKEKKITELEADLKSAATQYSTVTEKIQAQLLSFPDWKEQFDTGKLQTRLGNLAKTWNDSEKSLDANRQQAANLCARLDILTPALAANTAGLLRKENIHKENLAELEGFIANRKSILKGNNIADIETNYTTRKEQLLKIKESVEIQKEKTGRQKAQIDGIILQIEQDIINTGKQRDNLKKEIVEWLNTGEHQINQELLKGLMAKTNEWITTEKNELSMLRNHELIAKTTLKEREGRLHKHLLSSEKPSEGETKERIEQQAAEIKTKTEEITNRLSEINLIISKYNDNKTIKEKYTREFAEKQESYDNWSKLNRFLGSAKGDKFKTIAQGYTLDVLLSYANKHLHSLSKRYRLEKVPGTLALQVIDNDQLGDVRTVHTLSGGESFLISLALALGLSSLSSNKMKIESLFIDEGFGSLDIDTLSIAMDALENLQAQGRKIGVISHVEEMKERISTRIQVIKSTNGSSHIKIIG